MSEKMSPQDFAFWLQGFFEMTDAKELTPAQVKMIKEHLALVFKKVTPPLQIPVPQPIPIGAPTPWVPDPIIDPTIYCRSKEIVDILTLTTPIDVKIC